MNYLCIGKFLKPYGLKGQIKAIFFIDEALDLENFSSFYLKDPKVSGGYRKLGLEFLSYRDNFFILKVEGIVDRTLAENLKNQEIYVDEDELPELNGNSYYIKDLIGLTVFYKEEVFGKVVNFIDTASQFVLIMKLLNGKDLAVPFKDRYFPEVLIKEGKVIADNLEDFL
ncbi:MAG: ribosome maturation factor RimM [Brevinematales bacterium]|nr:ribosome maturation factor RimM [Brevinematales bacterium]